MATGGGKPADELEASEEMLLKDSCGRHFTLAQELVAGALKDTAAFAGIKGSFETSVGRCSFEHGYYQKQ